MLDIVGIQRREYEEKGSLSSRNFDHPSLFDRVVVKLTEEELEVSFHATERPRQVGLKMPRETAVAVANLILAATEGDLTSVSAEL